MRTSDIPHITGRTIEDEGVYTMSDEVYHADPVVHGSVSSTVLRMMTPPRGCAAKAKAYLERGRKPQGYLDAGSAYHTDMLGQGAPIERCPVLDKEGEPVTQWTTTAAKNWRKDARKRGTIPLLVHEAETVEAMRAATLAHPIVGPLFEPDTFTAEFVIVWYDHESGVWCRVKIDLVPDYVTLLRLVDLKTTARDVDPDTLARVIADYNYHQQHALYEMGCRVLGLAPDIEPMILFISKEYPHLITYRPIHPEDIKLGHEQNRAALNLYAQCRYSGYWPGYDDPRIDDEELKPLRLPRWYRTQARNLTTGDDW